MIIGGIFAFIFLMLFGIGTQQTGLDTLNKIAESSALNTAQLIFGIGTAVMMFILIGALYLSGRERNRQRGRR